MTFLETDIKGCYVFEYLKDEDSRGDFSRVLCKKDMLHMGIEFDVKQSSFAFNDKKKTARGLHYQKKPYGENKVIVCLSGVIDVFVKDLDDKKTVISHRLDSRLSRREAIYIPKHCASGYITIEDGSSVLYYMDEYYHPESQKVIAIEIEGAIMSDRDKKSQGKE